MPGNLIPDNFGGNIFISAMHGNISRSLTNALGVAYTWLASSGDKLATNNYFRKRRQIVVVLDRSNNTYPNNYSLIGDPFNCAIICSHMLQKG